MRSAVWAGMDYPVTQPYNPTIHTGIDIGCPSGTIIYAARAGVVERVQTGMTSVRVFAERDFYLHGTSQVQVGQLIREGQPVIMSGAVQVDPRYPLTGPHLHYEIQNGFSLPGAPPSAPEAPLDPVPVLLAAHTFGSAAGQLGGFLMALTDAEQADLYQKTNFIYNLLIAGNLQNPPHDLLAQMQGHFATLEAATAALKAQIAALPAPTPAVTSATLSGTLTAPVTVTLK